MDEKKVYRDWWERHDGIDLWSVPHFLFGVLMGLSPFFLPLSSYTALVVTVIVSVAWECLEIVGGIHESVANRIFDVGLHVFGFLLVSTFLAEHPQRTDTLIPSAIALLIAYGGMNLSGWIAYRRRKRRSP